MDPVRFDTLTRTLSSTGTRRGALGALLAGALSLLGVTETEARRKTKNRRQQKRTRQQRRTHDAKAKNRRKTSAEGPCGNGSPKANACKRDGQCCTGTCDKQKGRCRCKKLGEGCRQDRNCCATFGQPMTCQSGSCQAVVPAPPPPPPPPTPACAETCTGGCCDGVGSCQPGTAATACGTGGAGCMSCSNPTPVCASNTCAACAGGDCPAGQVCCGGSCVTGDCCDRTTCPTIKPICVTNVCTVCTAHTECGEGFLCLSDGRCQACTVTCPGGTCAGTELQTAMDGGGTVYVCPGRYTGSFVLIMTQPVTVIGAGDGPDVSSSTILDALEGGVVMEIRVGTATATLERLRVTGGRAVGSLAGAAGVRLMAGSEQLIASSVTDNVTSFGRRGGGISGFGTLEMTDCTIWDNHAQGGGGFGGGIYFDTFNTGTTLRMTACVVRGNSATLNGAGLLINGGATR